MDLADQIDDYICTFEGIGDLTADMLAMFIFVWAVLALFLIWLCKFLYNKYVNNNNNNKNATINNKITTDLNSISGSGSSVLNREKRQSSEPRELSASKDVKEQFSSKPIGGSLTRGTNRGRPGQLGGIGGTTPAPVVRKRLNARMSPGPELRTKPRFISPPSNVVGPETTSVTWTSKVFCWLYSDLVIVNELFATWVQALNNLTSKVAEDHGVSVEIVRVLPDSPPPNLQNIFCDSEEHDPSKMIISCDCDATPVLQIRAVRLKTGKMETHHYKVTVSRFRARLSAPMNYNTLKGEMKIEGYPDIRIALNSVGAVKPMDQDEQQLQDIITQILTMALRDTIYPIDFSIYATCPRAPDIQPPENPVMFMPYNSDNNYPINEDMMMYNLDQYDSFNPTIVSKPSERRLLVKIVKGEGLIKAKDPYCVVEMDEPPQKNQTGARQGAEPYWDEHFLFDLSPQSAELLFEVYDRPLNPRDSPKFLGLGLVGIDELNVGPSSSQILTLQPRPYENEAVNGAIMVEFVFIERAEVPTGPRPYKLKEALKIDTPMINEHLRNGSDLADAAVKAIKDGALGKTVNGQPSKSTLIIHSVQRNNRSPFKVELNKDGQIEMNENIIEENISEENTTQPDVSAVVNTESSPQLQEFINENNEILTDKPITTETQKLIDNEKGNTNSSTLANGNIENESFGRPGAQSSPQSNGHSSGLTLNHSASGSTLAAHQQQQQQQQQQNNNLIDERSRSKKRDFFGTIKRRFGKSRTRSKSIDRDMIPIDVENMNGSNSRSMSLDRRAAKQADGNLKNNNARMNLSNSTSSPGPRNLVPPFDQSRRSSLSESSAISGFSSASTKTFLHEASALVLETIENGVKRHFLVPMAIAQRPRWRRKGTKLHVYNDHTFVAKHLSGSGLVCAICTKSIPRRPGKQGYECRDCQLICHKQCHIRAPQACPNPTILSMELSKLNMAGVDRSIRKV